MGNVRVTNETKIQNFLDEKNFHISNTDCTNTFQNQIIKTIDNSKIFIPQNSQWKYIKLNTSAPTIKGLINIHKTKQPICPIVKWRNAPAYKSTTIYPHNHPINFTLYILIFIL